MSDDMMENEIERLLRQATPRGADAALRGRVLAEIDEKLRPRAVGPALPAGKAGPTELERGSPWLRRSALAVAASILVGIALNIWATRAAERRLAQVLGPPRVSKQAMEIAEVVESVADAKTAQWAYERLTAPPPRRAVVAAYAAYTDALRRLLDESFVIPNGPSDETPKTNPPLDGNRPGRAGRGTTDCQRHPGLDHRYTA